MSTASFNKKRLLKQYGLIIAGCLIAAAAYPLFLEANHIAPGGLTGLSTILNYYFHWPIGLTSLIMNIPLMIIGWRMIGAGFVVRTLVATLLFSLTIDVLVLKPLTQDPMLASIFGGILLGVGLGLIMRGSATTGGTDLMARIIHHHYRAIPVSAFLFAFDFSVVMLAWIFLSAQHAMYAIVCVFVTTKVLDQVLVGLGTDKACYIISKQHEQIEQRLMRELERGVTRFNAVGAFSGQDTKMLLCVVGRLEAVKVKTIVKDEDPLAFMFITDTHETLGEGFENLLQEDN
ncbi:MAG: YitT family protein [Clostridiales bacterium]|jgi:uncharacterized membrane-anchored protein YitT (DUF2179 family)|nr:YitT family protein [Clostridiales bacterium]